SALAGFLQIFAVVRHDALSANGLLLLTLGYALVILFFAVSARRRRESSRTLTAVALAAFAVSALHLSRHSSANDSWVVELIGHHASLPLVLVILYQDYRFALADLFLKRALSVLALVAVVVAAYVTLVAPLIGRDADELRIGVPGVLLTAWIATALLYPVLRRATDRFVDRVMLHRVDYRRVRHAIAARSALSVHRADDGRPPHHGFAVPRHRDTLSAHGVVARGAASNGRVCHAP